MPQRKAQSEFIPRNGQQKLIDYLPQVESGDKITIRWPGGYGKSIGMALAWKHAFESGAANRCLIVVANDAQKEQIARDFPGDCRLVGAPADGGVWRFNSDSSSLAACVSGKCIIYVTVINTLWSHTRTGAANITRELLQTPGTRWQISFDEVQHLGNKSEWGLAAKQVMDEFSMFTVAMSATPFRKGGDELFGSPNSEISVSYQEALAERPRTLKPLVCRSYEYKVALTQDGEFMGEYTLTQLRNNIVPAGVTIDRWEERNNVRTSGQFISPMIYQPINVMLNKRSLTGKPLQMIYRAMSCSHAKTLCIQIKNLVPELRCDWVGTNGRSQSENRDVLAKFCPKKKAGKRPDPELDILVQVAMAGEGFDSVYVSDIVDLFPVSLDAGEIRNQDDQLWYRGTRYIEGTDDLACHIHVPCDHYLAVHAGKELAKYMDDKSANNLPDEREGGGGGDGPWEFPKPKKREVEFLAVFTEEQLEKGRAVLNTHTSEAISKPVAEMTEDERVELREKLSRAMFYETSEESHQEQVQLYRDSINRQVGRMARVLASRSDEVTGALIGRYKKQINGRIVSMFGKTREELSLDELEQLHDALNQELGGMRGA